MEEGTTFGVKDFESRALEKKVTVKDTIIVKMRLTQV